MGKRAYVQNMFEVYRLTMLNMLNHCSIRVQLNGPPSGKEVG